MKKNTAIMMFLFAALALFTVQANAAKQINDISDINLTVFVPCAAGGAGEIVDLSGPLHTLITFTINGNKYQATGVTKDFSFKFSFQNGQANQTFVNNFRIIGQGPGNNFLVHEVAHITFNANGTVTVFHDNFSIDCK